ncbi:MAG TPA: hypothetical protein VLW06_00555 [Terriglobales bacterium]|nr:hypothetical protein [Terriglobales bacterium]
MSRVFTNLCLTLILLLPFSGLAASQQRMKAPKAQAKPSPAQPQPASRQAPQPPIAPEHEPSSPPEVTFQDGKLTIVARNSTMADVLNAVKQKTGAAVDMPASSGERVVGQFGPGAARDVMAQLLNGSHFDYVLLGSAADPTGLKKIVLMAKVSGPEPAHQQAQANQPPQQQFQNLQAVPEVESESQDDNAGEASPNMVQPPDQESQSDDQSSDDQQNNQPVVKTPEQLLRELQQQQQRQQQDQSGPPGAPGQPPQ